MADHKKNNPLDEPRLEDHENGEFVDDLDIDNDMDVSDDFTTDPDYADRPQKKSGLSNVILLGGAAVVVVGAGMFFLPGFLGSESETAPAPQQQSNEQIVQEPAATNKQIAEAAVSDTTSNQNIQSGGLLSNPDILQDSPDLTQRVQSSAEGPTEDFGALETDSFRQLQDTASSNYTDNMDDLFSENNTDTNGYDAEPLPQLPSASDEVVPAEDSMGDDITYNNSDNSPYPQEDMSAMTTEASKQPSLASRFASSDSENNAPMAQRLNDISANMEALAGEIGTMINMMSSRIDALESRPVQQSQSATDTQSLQNAIRRLEQKIEKLEQNNSVKPQVKMEPAPKQESKPSGTSASSKPKIKMEEPAAAKPQPQASSLWTLRGASVDEAYIADNKSGTVRTVRVGETVNGFGRITSIAVESGRWVVRGTQGSITQ